MTDQIADAGVTQPTSDAAPAAPAQGNQAAPATSLLGGEPAAQETPGADQPAEGAPGDLGVARDMFEGRAIFANVELTAAVTGGTSVEVQIITSAAANLGTPTVIGTSGAIPVASLTLGKRIAIQGNPQLGSTGQRYLGLQYVNVGANTTGAAYADFGPSIQDGQKFHASGFSVL